MKTRIAYPDLPHLLRMEKIGRGRSFRPEKFVSAYDVPDTDVEYDEPLIGLRVGRKVLHPRFGIGHVEHIEGRWENAKVKILFNEWGHKYLKLKYANLKLV